jgi:hypothetical protein
VVRVQVLSKKDDVNWGYNAATDTYEDLMAAGIIDPTKVCVRHCRAACGASAWTAVRAVQCQRRCRLSTSLLSAGLQESSVPAW